MEKCGDVETFGAVKNFSTGSQVLGGTGGYYYYYYYYYYYCCYYYY